MKVNRIENKETEAVYFEFVFSEDVSFKFNYQRKDERREKHLWFSINSRDLRIFFYPGIEKKELEVMREVMDEILLEMGEDEEDELVSLPIPPATGGN